jgi:chromosome partitioning protein
MAALTQNCSVCSTEFEPRFHYQAEERVEQDATGRPRFRTVYYCSQECLQRSHGGETGTAVCEACGEQFRPTLVSQVIYVARRRRYACSPRCRARVLSDARIPRLGEPARASAGAAPRRTASESSLPRVLAVFNHKGGTAKTTTAVTVAAGLATRGQRVLLIDTDGQGNVAVSFGLKPNRTLYHVLVLGLRCQDAVVEVRPGLDVLPSNETLAAAELYLAGRQRRDRVLASRLEGVRDAYDCVIVDCSPSLSLLNQNALVLADAVLCPVACDYLSLVGVRQVLRTVSQVNKLLGHPLALWGVLPTQFDARARICHEAVDTLRRHFRERCLEPVRMSIKVKEAPARAQTLLEYAPDSTAALDYLAVVDRILANGNRDDRTTEERAAVAGGVG